MFFEECKTIEEVKKTYKALAMCLHPDKGGNAELMKKLNQEYENFIEKLEKKNAIDEDEAFYLNLINDIFQFSNLKPTFDPAFIEGVWERYQNVGRFSDSQKKSLKNIYEKWRVEKHLKEANEND